MTAFGDLRARLVWITAFRTVAATLLLLVNAFRLFSGPPTEEAGSPEVDPYHRVVHSRAEPVLLLVNGRVVQTG